MKAAVSEVQKTLKLADSLLESDRNIIYMYFNLPQFLVNQYHNLHHVYL